MRRTWTWTFDLPPDQLWPVLADTNRSNEAMGPPPYAQETPQANGTVLRRGRGKAAGFVLEWAGKPYEWISGRHFRQSHVFTKGPFRRFGPVFDLEADSMGGSRVPPSITSARRSTWPRAYRAKVPARTSCCHRRSPRIPRCRK